MKRCWTWNHAWQKQDQRTQVVSYCSQTCKRLSNNTVDSRMKLEKVLQVHSLAATCTVRVFEHQRRVVFESSAAARVQTDTSILPGNKISVVFLRLVMHDTTRAVFDVYPEVRIKVCG